VVLEQRSELVPLLSRHKVEHGQAAALVERVEQVSASSGAILVSTSAASLSERERRNSP